MGGDGAINIFSSGERKILYEGKVKSRTSLSVERGGGRWESALDDRQSKRYVLGGGRKAGLRMSLAERC